MAPDPEIQQALELLRELRKTEARIKEFLAQHDISVGDTQISLQRFIADKMASQ